MIENLREAAATTGSAPSAVPPDPAGVAGAVAAARDYLLRLQHDDGHWCGELEGDTILESDYAILLAFLGRRDSPKIAKLAEYLKRQQLPEGGWGNYPGGPPDISPSVKAYLTLKLAGYSPDEPFMKRARDCVLDLGGVVKCNTFTKIYLALLGQYEWDGCPAIPPEMILAPNWFYFNLYELSSWSRTIIVPLSIIWAHKPVTPLPPECCIDELFVGGKDPTRMPLPWDRRPISWRNFFLVVDRLLKLVERSRLDVLRPRALRACEAWMLERFERSGGLGAIFPPMVNAVIALRLLGYPDDHPQVTRAHRELERLEIEEDGTLRLQPCFSPVWDTAIATIALHESGLEASHEALRRSTEWLLSKEVRHGGDWQVKNRKVVPSGWYFEYENEFYPDVDDTAMVLMALKRCLPEGSPGWAALERGRRWVRALRCRDGGWASFDRDNDRMVFSHVPFADHNAMLDPSTVDITARVLEMMSHFGHTLEEPEVRTAVEYIRRRQEPDGSWFGRWGVNYLYGTWQALRGLASVGEDMTQPYVTRAADWLRSVQHADGGWGETCGTYDNPSLKGQGPSTASQTAWALMGLYAAGDTDSPSVRRGVRYLVETQEADGSWSEEAFTGTGFPRVFYLKYHLYRIYFPLLALAEYHRRVCR